MVWWYSSDGRGRPGALHGGVAPALVRWLQVLALALVVGLLPACGGGGGAELPPVVVPPTVPPVDPLADAARLARLSASFRPDARQVSLYWTDTFASESGFRIEQLSGADWLALQTVPAAAGSGSAQSWTLPLTADATLRVVALVGSSVVALQTVAQSEQIAVAARAAPPAIALSSSEPLQARVTLSVSGAPAGATVRYYADFASLGPALATAPYEQSWDTTTGSNGSHLLQAMVQVTADYTIESRRQVLVGNPVVAPGLQMTMSVAPSFESTVVSVLASSDVGVASVRLFVDGQPAGTLTLPNACSDNRVCASKLYSFTLPYAAYSNGRHTVLAVATDNNLAKAQADTTVEMNDPPHVTLSRPADSEIVANGTLRVTGSASDDTVDVDVSILFGGVELRRIGAGSFDFSHDLSGTANGSYTLTVQARDRQGASRSVVRQVLVQATSALQPELVAGLGAGNQLVGADGDAALVIWEPVPDPAPADVEKRARVLRGAAASGVSTVFLDKADLSYQRGWGFSTGRSVAYGIGDDSAGAYNAYLWNFDGSRRNLSKAAGDPSPWQFSPTLAGDWVAWAVGGPADHFQLMQLSTGQATSVPGPAGASRVGSEAFAVMPRVGSALLAYWVIDSGTTVNDSLYSVHLYDSATRATQRLSPPAVRDVYVQGDGQRIAWQRLEKGNTGAPFAIVVASVAQPLLQKTISANASQFVLRDGLLAWQEGNATSNLIKVDDGAVTTVISNKLAARLVTAGGGAVAYTLDGGLYLWTPAAGSRLVLDKLPGEVVLTQGWLYFTVGFGRALHRVAL